MPQPYVISVILNTNRRDDTLECLASLMASTYRNHKAIVLDNASTDGSAEAIRAAFPNVEVIGLTKNEGYAGNNNVGVRAALEQGADWVFVLNEDTVLDPECLERLVAAAEADGRIGMVGPLVYHHDEPTVIQSAGGRLGAHWEAHHIGQNEDDAGQFGAPREVEWLSGCAILVRSAAIRDVGALDTSFFYYWEEVEWCFRLARAGWRLVNVAQARLWHKGVQRNYKPKPSLAYYNTRNRFMLLAKHRAPLRIWAYNWFQTLRTLASYTVRPKWRGHRAHRDAMWRGTVDFLMRRTGRGAI